MAAGALQVVEHVDARPVLRADIVALPHALRGVVALPEHAQQVLVADLLGIEHHEHHFVVTGAAGADLFVGRVRREATGVADGGRVDAGGLPELALRAPETPEPEHRLVETLGDRGFDRRVEHEVARRNAECARRAARERVFRGGNLGLVTAREHRNLFRFFFVCFVQFVRWWCQFVFGRWIGRPRSWRTWFSSSISIAWVAAICDASCCVLPNRALAAAYSAMCSPPS